jgi:hypothetical protein
VSTSADFPQNDPSAECLVLVSDTSTEAERLIASLRVRGFKVRDVPLMLLAGRVEVQRPRLVICNGQAQSAVNAIRKMRDGSWGKQVDILLIGHEPTVTDALRALLPDIDQRTFPRPIDVYSILQRVEEVIGTAELASKPGTRSMAALPRVAPSAAAAAGRSPTPAPRRARSSMPSSSQRLESLGASVRGEAPRMPDSIRGDVGEPSSPRAASVAPPSDPGTSEPMLSGLSVARMSEELELLLSEADKRLANGPVSIQPMSIPGSRLSPEQELDAILPPDVLAALDESVDLDEDDETSHPVPRPRERPSSALPPRPQQPVVSESRVAPPEVAADRAASVHAALEEDTPVGRLAVRGRFNTAAGVSEPPDAGLHGSVLTPMPASVKSHHTQTAHHSQGLSSPQASSTAEFTDHAMDREHTSAPHHDLDRRRRGDSESVVPGTNPEVDGPSVLSHAEHAAPAREAPKSVPQASRPGEYRSSPWRAFEDAPIGNTREPFPSEQAPATVSNRYDENHSTNPPAGHRFRPSAASAGVSHAESPRQPMAPEPPRPLADTGTDNHVHLEVPSALGSGDVVRALARCVRSRYSGALAIEDDSGIRRVVMREGDFVMVASGVDGESLVAFLIQKGDLDADAARLARKLPQFGRHAGAALIAHGYLRQDELWLVLRAHAEWLLGKALGVAQGSAGLETELPARLSAEPAVFGGATGAEILVEVARRIIVPETAIERMGGARVRLSRGSLSRLLSECALPNAEAQLVERAAGATLDDLLLQSSTPDFAAAIYVLVELGVLDAMAPSADSMRDARKPLERDGLDDNAVRSRVANRRALVDDGDYFAVLGIARDATGYEVRHAYLNLRREFEPNRLLSASTVDLRDDVDLILEVLDEAYEILRDAARRERYRRALESPPAAMNH